MNKKPKKLRKIIIVLAALLVLGAAGFFVAKNFFFDEASAQNYTEYTVARGNLSVSLSGSGSIQPNAQYDVVSMIGGDVIEDFFVEGDSVEKGSTLYIFDSVDIEGTMERANLSLEKSKLSYDRTQESYSALNIYASDTGRVSEIYVKTGDNINSGGKVAKIIDGRYFNVRIPFSSTDIPLLHVDDRVDVVIENTFETLSGVITKIYNSNRIIDGYMEVTDVEIRVENPGALSEGVYVSVNAGSLSCFEGGVLTGSSEKIVLAKTAGLVEKVNVVEGEYIDSGTLIAELYNETAENNLRDSSISLKEAELSWENTEKQLKDYRITAPISGSIISKSIKAGDRLEKNTKTVMAVIADMSIMSFTIQIDELDIAKISKGQQVQITVDALSRQRFTGTVDNVGILGSSSSGVTTYPVKIVFDQSEGVWPGMNATASIVLESVSDALIIPVSAVGRGNIVLVKGPAPEGDTASEVSSSGGSASGGSTSGGSASDTPFVIPSAPGGPIRQPDSGDSSGGRYSDSSGESGATGGQNRQFGGGNPGDRYSDGSGESGATGGPVRRYGGDGNPGDRYSDSSGESDAPEGLSPSGGALGWEGARFRGDPEARARFMSESGITEDELEAMRSQRRVDSGQGMARPPDGASANYPPPGAGPGSVERAGFNMPEAPANSHYVFVELGLNNESFIEVRSGLKEGDVIMIEVASQNSLRQNPMFMAPMMRGPGTFQTQRIPDGGGNTQRRSGPPDGEAARRD